MSNFLKQLEERVRKGNPVFIAPNATVVGDVELGDFSSVWFQAVIRADMGKVLVGKRSNIQDGVIIHTDPGLDVTIGESCVIGHGAVLHGCSIGDFSLVGIRATILNHAVIGKGCIIGANALVTERMVVPDYSMVLGSPGKIVKTLSPEIIEQIKLGADAYVEEMKLFLS